METFLQLLVGGLLLGGILALLSAGLTLIFGVMRVVNFAQGDFVMLGMYLAFYVYAFQAINPVFLALLSFVVLGLVGVAMHWLLVKRVTGLGGAAIGGHDAQLILTLGISLVLQNGALMVFGAQPRVLRTGMSADSINIGGVLINAPRALAFAVAIVLTGALFWFLKYTIMGKFLRAAADDPEAATYVGINVERAHSLSFAVGVGLAAAGGAMLATFYPMQPYVAWDFIVLMFVAVVLGGMGSVLGAFLGGLTIGVVQSLSLFVLPLQLQLVAVFVIFLLVLYVRPQGMFGQRVRV